jgi:integrase/recombinase XerD
VVALKVTDIDSQRMTLRVEQGKGRKDRYAMLPQLLLERLRTWWRVARAQGKMLIIYRSCRRERAGHLRPAEPARA